MLNLERVIEQADMISLGYAFTIKGPFIRDLNLYNPECAAVIEHDGAVVETNMNDRELQKMLQVYQKNKEFLQVDDLIDRMNDGLD